MFTAVPAETEAPLAPGGPTTSGDRAFVARLNTELLRRPARLVAACLASVAGPAVVAQAGWINAQPAFDVRPAEDPSAGSVAAPVPGDRAGWIAVARQASATCPGLSSAVLVAIGSLESSLGLQTGFSSAGAVGPMQFLPSTWAAYGADGDGDGVSDVMNPIDAVHGAARLLCANGGGDPDRLPSALWNYNHSHDYVRQVMSLARFIPADT
ncbi:MAG: lytic murein transglycosylase [Acidimicrobiales bacterium]